MVGRNAAKTDSDQPESPDRHAFVQHHALDAFGHRGVGDFRPRGQRLLSTHDPAIRTEVLRTVLIAYAAASLLHFGHNAEHLSEYPNLPTWITRADVYLSWLVQTAIGLESL